MSVITAADLKRFAPRADKTIVAAFVTHGDAAFARWGITTGARLRMFMAQVKVESGNLTALFENMNYSAARLHAVWPQRFPTVASAERYAHNPEALADKVYGGRMGNTGPHDGWLCRGEGLLDTTGLTNFETLAAHMGQSVDATRAALTSEAGMVDCAAACFHMLGCLPYADRGDLIGCTHRVNGGLIGLTDRRLALELAARIWPVIRSPQATPQTPATATAAPVLPVPPTPVPAAPPAPSARLPAPAPASPPASTPPRLSFWAWLSALFARTDG